MVNLQGKVILITGASRGLGRAMAEGLAEASANLVLTARRGSDARLAEVVHSIVHRGAQGEMLEILGDVANPEDCETIIRETRERFGTLDVLINNAGIGMDLIGPLKANNRQFYNIPVDIWRRIVDTNINGIFLMARAAMPLFLSQRRGRIINVTTSYVTMLKPGFCPYGPSKAAAEAMTVIWAKELAGTGIMVNSLSPGAGVDTSLMPAEDWPDRSKLLPVSVMVPAAVWLSSDESEGITGMRIVGKDWNTALPPAQAFKGASSRVAIADEKPQN